MILNVLQGFFPNECYVCELRCSQTRNVELEL